MNSILYTLLTLIRPRDRDRVVGFIEKIAALVDKNGGGYLTAIHVGAGGDETQIGRWEPADEIEYLVWLHALLKRQAAVASPASAKVRMRAWHTGGKSGPSVTAVLEPATAQESRAIAALPAPAETACAGDRGTSPLGEAPEAGELLTIPSGSDATGRLAAVEEQNANLKQKLTIENETRRWYEDVWRESLATNRALEKELREAHAALAERGALQREITRAEARNERKDDLIRKKDEQIRELLRTNRAIVADRDGIAAELDELGDEVEDFVQEMGGE